MASRWMVDASYTNPCSSGLVYCWLFSGRVHMVILTPLIQARRTCWTKTDTLLLLAHATQAQAVAMVRAPIREVCQVDWALLPFPLGDICYNFLDVAGYNSWQNYLVLGLGAVLWPTATLSCQ